MGIAARRSAWLHAAPLAAALAIGAVHGPSRSDTPQLPAITVLVVSHGWHSGLIVPAALADAHGWPVRREFPQAKYFEVGWGDRAFYQAADPSWWLGLRALLWPSPGVLHIVALHEPPAAAFRGVPMIALHISHEGAQRLGASIAASHDHGADGAPVALGPAVYGQGRFYASVDRFHLLATCNVWVARRLRDAGLDLHPTFALTSAMLLGQLERLATTVPAASAASATN